MLSTDPSIECDQLIQEGRFILEEELMLSTTWGQGPQGCSAYEGFACWCVMNSLPFLWLPFLNISIYFIYIYIFDIIYNYIYILYFLLFAFVIVIVLVVVVFSGESVCSFSGRWNLVVAAASPSAKFEGQPPSDFPIRIAAITAILFGAPPQEYVCGDEFMVDIGRQTSTRCTTFSARLGVRKLHSAVQGLFLIGALLRQSPVICWIGFAWGLQCFFNIFQAFSTCTLPFPSFSNQPRGKWMKMMDHVSTMTLGPWDGDGVNARHHAAPLTAIGLDIVIVFLGKIHHLERVILHLSTIQAPWSSLVCKFGISHDFGILHPDSESRHRQNHQMVCLDSTQKRLGNTCDLSLKSRAVPGTGRSGFVPMKS